MQIAIATPEQMSALDGWTPFPTDYLHPREIRVRILVLTREEEDDESGETEHKLITMNRTVLDLVTYPEIKSPGPMDYEDVWVWSVEKEGLVPLLSLFSEDWMAHFALGDLLERCHV